MCGRYVIVTKIKEIEKRFGKLTQQAISFQPTVNMSAGKLAPVVTSEQPDTVQLMQFGLTPHWASKNMYLINARSEGDHNKEDAPNYNGAKGIIEKPAFRKSIRSQRCLVIADAFIEGPKNIGLDQPFCVYLRNGRKPFAMAGIWDRWENPLNGEVISSFAIITTPGNEVLQKIGHHRSPLLLHEFEEKQWLDPRLSLQDVTSMLRPFPAQEMNAYRISSDIKRASADGSDLLAPIGERVIPEFTYEVYQDIQMFGMGESRSRERKNNRQLGLFD